MQKVMDFRTSEKLSLLHDTFDTIFIDDPNASLSSVMRDASDNMMYRNGDIIFIKHADTTDVYDVGYIHGRILLSTAKPNSDCYEFPLYLIKNARSFDTVQVANGLRITNAEILLNGIVTNTDNGNTNFFDTVRVNSKYFTGA